MSSKLPTEWFASAASGLTAGCYEVSLVPTHALRPTELIEPDRASALIDQIEQAGIWTRAILIEASMHAVMDGHHRLNAALRLGLARVPCIRLQYGDPRLLLTSWRADFPVTEGMVLASARTGYPLPPRTSRHILTPPPRSVAVPLALLRIGTDVPSTAADFALPVELMATA